MGIQDFCSTYPGKAPPLRTGAGKGGSERGEKEGRGGSGGVGPRWRGSAAAWVTLRGHHTFPSSRMMTLSGSIDSPGGVLQNTKNSAESHFSPQEFFSSGCATYGGPPGRHAQIQSRTVAPPVSNCATRDGHKRKPEEAGPGQTARAEAEHKRQQRRRTAPLKTLSTPRLLEPTTRPMRAQPIKAPSFIVTS